MRWESALLLSSCQDALLADDWAAGCLIWETEPKDLTNLVFFLRDTFPFRQREIHAARLSTQDYWDRHGVRDFKTEPWHWDTPPKPGARTTSGSRKAAMIMPVPPQPMCPKETRVSVSYGLGLSHDDQGRDIVRLKSSAVSHDVPYGDHFSVEENIEMVREGDGVLVTKSFSADFVKRTFLRSMIESSIKNSQKDTCEKLMSVLQSYAEDMSPVNVGSPTSCTPRPRSSNSGIFGMIDDDESSMEDAVSIGDDGFESAEEDPVISAALAGVDDDMDGSLVSALPSIVDFLGDLGDTISSIAANTWVKHNAIKNVDLRCEASRASVL